jgi:hypothetical protein
MHSQQQGHQHVQPAPPAAAPWLHPVPQQVPSVPVAKSSSPPQLPPPDEAPLPQQKADLATQQKAAAALFASSSDEEEEGGAQRQPQRRQEQLQTRGARGAVKFNISAAAAGKVASASAAEAGSSAGTAVHAVSAPPPAGTPPATTAAGAAALETSPAPPPKPSPAEQAAALAAALASAPAPGSFWDPTWELEARCVHLLSRCGPLPATALMSHLYITWLPPFLRETAVEPVPCTFLRLLQERPALFAACAAVDGQQAAWVAVPGAAGFVRYKRALLEHWGGRARRRQSSRSCQRQ